MVKEELILKYLNNDISSADAEEVRLWAEQNPEDFQLMQDIWNESEHAGDIEIFDTENEWESFIGMLDEVEVSGESEKAEYQSDDTPVIQLEPKVNEAKEISLWKEWRPVAIFASLLLIAVVSYVLWPRGYDISYLAENENSELTLPDNTVVNVDKGSTIVYPNTFKNKEKRIVKLNGIATFDIEPNPDQPFIVETAHTGVKAIGTIFKVDATKEEQTGVENIEGLIQFFELKNEENFVEVKEGESFVYDINEGFKETTPQPEPEPVIRTFEAPTLPDIPYHTVTEIINHIRLISNGHTIYKGDDIDWNKKIQIDLTTTNVNKLFRDIRKKALLKVEKKDCDDCFEILKFRVY